MRALSASRCLAARASASTRARSAASPLATASARVQVSALAAASGAAFSRFERSWRARAPARSFFCVARRAAVEALVLLPRRWRDLFEGLFGGYRLLHGDAFLDRYTILRFEGITVL